MRRASMCCAKGRRSYCCQRERCHRDWPGHRGTSSAVQTACRYKLQRAHLRVALSKVVSYNVIAFIQVDIQVMLRACICGFPPLSDDPQLDRSQAGGRPVRESQRQCHRQPPQHLSALRCGCRHEELCGGERKCSEIQTHIRTSNRFLCGRSVCVFSWGLDLSKDFTASERSRLSIMSVFVLWASALCYITVRPK